MSEEVSFSLQTLRDAANEAQFNDKLEIEEGMFYAADQIANEYGLKSPLRNKKMNMSDVFETSIGDDAKVKNDDASSPHFSPQVEPKRQESPASILKDNVDALFTDVGFIPKQNLENDLIDDVDALLKMHQKKELMIEKAKEIKNVVIETKKPNSKTKDRYLQRLKGNINQQNSLNASRSNNGQSSLQTAPSKISILLSLADDKEWGEKIRRSFANPTEELLFRNMKKVSTSRPGSARSPGAKSSQPNTKSSSRSGAQSVSGDTKSKLAYEAMRRSTSRLSAPSQPGPSRIDTLIDPTLKYSTLSDAKECTFRPCIAGKAHAKKKRGGEDDDGPKEDAKYGFISRQEAEERNRRENLTFEMGKAKYDALIDKKACPECGAKQSYDEVKEKRKVCPNCRVEYCPQLSWAKVSQRFFRKGAQYAERAEAKLEVVKRELQEDFQCSERKVFDQATGRVLTVRSDGKAVLTADQKAEFYRRLEEEKTQRETNLALLTKQLYDDRCPFKPTLKKKQHKGDSDEEAEDSEEERDAFKAFIRRVDEDLDYRREALPAKYLPVRARRNDEQDAPLPFKC
jgi:hypothetical protein